MYVFHVWDIYTHKDRYYCWSGGGGGEEEKVIIIKLVSRVAVPAELGVMMAALEGERERDVALVIINYVINGGEETGIIPSFLNASQQVSASQAGLLHDLRTRESKVIQERVSPFSLFISRQFILSSSVLSAIASVQSIKRLFPGAQQSSWCMSVLWNNFSNFHITGIRRIFLHEPAGRWRTGTG